MRTGLPGAPLIAPREWRWILAAAGAVTAFSAIPYLVAWTLTPPGHVWMGTTHNGVDTAVHWSWIVQARDGSFFLSNLFAAEPDSGRFVHLWAWGIGTVAAAARTPYAVVYHLARLLFTFTSVVLVYRLAAYVVPQTEPRRWATAVVAAGAGLGWLVGLSGAPFGSADLVQPEVVTFLALYSSGLFAFSITLFLLALTSLLEAERTGRTRDAIVAGLALLLLINVHTYDAVPLVVIVGAHLVIGRLRHGRFSTRLLRAAGIAAAVAAPAAAWMLWYLSTDAVFQLRAAVPTPSLPLGHYLLGFGLLIPLAVIGARTEGAERDMVVLLVAWAFLQLGLGYLPVGLQRKLLMGVHIPVALLAGLGMVRVRLRRGGLWAAAVVFVLLSLSNVFFTARDLHALISRGGDLSNFRAYVPRVTYDGFTRAGETPATAVIATSPEYSPHVAMVAGRTTLPGHWGETPHYREKQALVRAVLEERLSLAAFAGATGATHLLIDDRLILLP
ncbi:MAG: hypothetical protein ABFS34_06120 [Gemmatimonadota bacterium]